MHSLAAAQRQQKCKPIRPRLVASIWGRSEAQAPSQTTRSGESCDALVRNRSEAQAHSQTRGPQCQTWTA